jgi:two-component system, OmpR family, phosphate regulon sensor histidine kinase PhoR
MVRSGAKNFAFNTLITVSILLLLVFQFLWLQSSYEKAHDSLRREVNSIFRSTIFELRDSIFFKRIMPLQNINFFDDDSLRVTRTPNSPNSKIDSIKVSGTASTVKVFISSSSGNDSIMKAIGPLTRQLSNSRVAAVQGFDIRIAADTLNTDSITHYFQKKLAEASIFLHVSTDKVDPPSTGFPVLHFEIPNTFNQLSKEMAKPEPVSLSDTLRTEPIRLSPRRLYQASLTGVRSTLLKGITTQFLFCVFLTVVIVASFLIMNRNIRSQQKLVEVKDAFISNVTHELKTPIATVSVALEALQNFNHNLTPEKTKEYIAMAQTELTRLSSMTDKILKTTILEETEVTLTEEVNLNDIIHECLHSMTLLIEKSGSTVRFDSSDKQPIVKGSALHLTGVISNLVENSIKYSPAGSSIIVATEVKSSMAVIYVKDNGVGISPEYHKKIFDKFFRVPSGNIHNTKGYGLGLNYVANTIKSHNGKINVISEPGKGTEFIIELPLTTSPKPL